ncbi:MAG TPA: ATP-binding protein [Candidatus Tumulicola sp.]
MAARVWSFEAVKAEKALFEKTNYLDFLRSVCTPDSDYDAAVMVFTELVADVVRHAAGPIEIEVRSNGTGGAFLQVADSGRPFAFAPALPADMSESGRGLYIVFKFCSDVSVSRSEHGNIVLVRLPVEWSS